MTPNQITGTANALRALLEDGHRQGLTPAFDPARVSSLFTSDAYHVQTYWREPEGGFVTLSVVVNTDGTVSCKPATWDDDARPDPEGRPGVKVLGAKRSHPDGQPYYSADWLP